MLSLQTKLSLFSLLTPPFFIRKITFFERGGGNSIKQTYVEEGGGACKTNRYQQGGRGCGKFDILSERTF